MFLTHEELYGLTHKRQHRKQAAACREMGIPFRVRPDGSVAVARAIFDTGGQSRATMPSPTIRLKETRHGPQSQRK